MGDCIFNWHHVDALPLFSATLKVMLEETEQQLFYIQYLKNGIYQIEKGLITRIITFYQTQLDKIMYYDEQLKRWLIDVNYYENINLFNNISLLKNNVKMIKNLTNSIIELANNSNYQPDEDNTTLTINKKIFLDFVDGRFKERNNA